MYARYDEVDHMKTLCFFVGKLNADRRVMKKACTHQPTRHRIYACVAKLSPDTSLSNANCGLMPTARFKI